MPEGAGQLAAGVVHEARHIPLVAVLSKLMQVSPVGQVGWATLQMAPEFEGVVPTHCPAVLQVSPPVQVPQLPPQPSEPHCLPEQLGVQTGSHLKVE